MGSKKPRNEKMKKEKIKNRGGLWRVGVTEMVIKEGNCCIGRRRGADVARGCGFGGRR
jgi:hypothetical protein